ncbi:MAG TPA: DVUA0089 family protein [Planctomycetota bacterium]|nr:DVUA0089 family protein [Planctomycetota bacterium]
MPCRMFSAFAVLALTLLTSAFAATPDSFEADDNIATAKTIQFGQPQDHSIHSPGGPATIPAGDIDFVTFTLTQRSGVTLETYATDFNSINSDTILRLYDSNGVQIGINDDGPFDTFSFLEIVLDPGTYYASVEEFNYTNGTGLTIDGYGIEARAIATDSFEPDDTLGTAKPITFNAPPQLHNFHVSTDQDWVSFTLPSRAEITITTTSPVAGAFTQLSLFTSLGNFVANGTYGNSNLTFLTTTLNAGSYVVQLTGSASAYGVSVRVTPDRFENDNTFATAKTITAIADPQVQPLQVHSLHTAGGPATTPPADIDFVTFVLGSPTGVFLSTVQTNGGPVPTLMRLYNSSQTEIATGGTTGNSSIATTLAAGTYFVSVEHQNRAAGNAEIIGEYILRLTVVLPDALEADDSIATAKTALSGVTQNHTLHFGGSATSTPPADRDFVAFTVTTKSSVTIATSQVGRVVDTFLRLYDSAGNQLTTDDNSGPGNYSLIVRTIDTPGTYYASVEQAGFATNVALPGDTYGLTVQVVPFDAFEADDTIAAAKAIATGETQIHSLHFGGGPATVPPADIDFVKFTLAATSTIVLQTDENTVSVLNTLLRLYDGNGVQIGQNSGGNPAGGGGARIAVTLVAGNYSASVEHLNRAAGFALPIESYKLSLQVITADTFEPDDSSAAAKDIANGATQTHTLHTGGNAGTTPPADIDFVKFALQSTATVKVKTQQAPLINQLLITIYDSGGNVVGTSTNFTDQLPLGINYVELELDAGAYFASIEETVAAGNGAGNPVSSYTLSLTVLGPDSFEADNTRTAAKAISSATPQTHSLHTGGDDTTADIDFVTFTLTEAQDVVVQTQEIPGKGLADTFIRLYDSAGTELASDDDSGYSGQYTSRLRLTLKAGTYYVSVEDYGLRFGFASTLEAYVLRIDLAPTPDDIYEPDNLPETAKQIAAGETQIRTLPTDYLTLNTDIDYVFFTLTVTSDIVIQTDVDVGPADTYLTLYDAAGSVIDEADDNNPNDSRTSRIVAKGLPAGTYYVSVESLDDAIAAYKLSLSTVATGSDAPPVVAGGTVYGARGASFSYLVPLLGKQPITLQAAGLPAGLQLVGDTITGSPTTADAAGTVVTLTATNSAGTATSSLKIVILEGAITTLAGNGVAGYSGDGGKAKNASLNFPTGLAIDSNGDIYIADRNNHVVRVLKTDATTKRVYISTVAGNGTAGFSGDNGPALNAQLNVPNALALDGNGNLYIVDRNNHAVRRVVLSTGIISTIAGRGVAGSFGEGVLATGALFNDPRGITANASALYIGDSGNHVVRRIDLATGIIKIVAGKMGVPTGADQTTTDALGDNGPAIQATLDTPNGLAIDSMGNLYIAEFGDSQSNGYNACRIRKIDANGIITTVAGNGDIGFSGDKGPAIGASLSFPTGIAVDAAGNLYISDFGNSRIRKVDVATGIIDTLVGGGVGDQLANDLGAGASDGGAMINAVLNNVYKVEVDSAGYLYIADAGSNRVRKAGNAVAPQITSADTHSATKDVLMTPDVNDYIIVSAGFPPPVFSATPFASAGQTLAGLGLALNDDAIGGTPNFGGKIDLNVVAQNGSGVDTQIVTFNVAGGGTVALSNSSGLLAEITATPNPAKVNSEVNFVAPDVNESATFLVSYVWDFGDGTPLGYGKIVKHTFTAVNDYFVKLTITDGGTGKIEKFVRVAVNASDASNAATSMLITKAQFKITGIAGKDSASIQGIIPLRGTSPDGGKTSPVNGKNAKLNIGELNVDLKAIGPKGTTPKDKFKSLKISNKPSGGVANEPANSPFKGQHKFSLSLKSSDLSALKTLGLVKGTSTTAQILNIPIMIRIGDDTYLQTVIIVFTPSKGTGAKLKEGSGVPSKSGGGL